MARGQHMEWRSIWVIGPAVALVAAVALVVFGLFVSANREVPEYTPVVLDAPTTAAASPDGISAYFLGDSYTAGVGSTDRSGYVAQVAVALGWQATADGQPGAGYTTAGSDGSQIFSDRVAGVIAAAPDVVVVQGGTNDTDGGAEEAAAQDLFQRLRDGLPDATIVAVGPTSPPEKDARQIEAVSAGLAAAASAVGVTFVDPAAGDWLGDDAYPDGVHPDNAGYAIYSQQLVAALQPLAVPQ